MEARAQRVEGTAAGPDTVTLVARSRLLRADNVVAVDPTIVLWATVSRFENRAARPLWAVASVVHHVTIRYLLGRAAWTRTAPG